MEGYNEITTRYLNGESVIRIAQDLSISREAVYQRLRLLPDWESRKREYMERRKEKKRYLMAEQAETIIKLRKEGLSLHKIKREMDLPMVKIKSILKYKGKEIGSRNVTRDREIVKLYEKGVKQADLAKKFKTTQPNISRIVRKGVT